MSALAEGSDNAVLGNQGAALAGSQPKAPSFFLRKRCLRRDWTAKSFLAEHSVLKAVRECGHWPIRESADSYGKVEVKVTAARASFSGLQTCGSVWACPVCAAHKWAERRTELEECVGAAVQQHKAIGMLTVTLRHNRSQSLDELLTALGVCWRKCQQSRAVRDASQKLGVVGFVRRTEVTWGASGWHPHYHILLVADRHTQSHWNQWQEVFQERWIQAAKDQGLQAPSIERGTDLRLFRTNGSAEVAVETAVTQYLTTAGTYLGAAAEMSANTSKQAKNGNMTCWDLLDDAMDIEGEALTRWNHYEKATKGKRAWAVSKSLRQLAADTDADPTPVEDKEPTYTIGAIHPEAWHRMRKEKRDLGYLLTAVESGWLAGFTETGTDEGAIWSAQLYLDRQLQSWNLRGYFEPYPASLPPPVYEDEPSVAEELEQLLAASAGQAEAEAPQPAPEGNFQLEADGLFS